MPTQPEVADALADVDKVNAEIDGEIAKVQVKVEKMYADFMFVKANETNAAIIDAAWHKYDVKAEAEIAKLQEKTERLTNKGLLKAKAAGLNVVMYLIEVEFADRKKMVDPIRVIDW